MNNTDYKLLYKEKYLKKINELKSDLKDFKKQFSVLKPELIINKFCRKVSYERDNLIQRHIPYDYEKSAISISKNFFKQELIEEFIRAKDRYAKNPIVHFINNDLPDLQKKHNALFKKNTKSELYEYEPKFLKASHTNIVEFIATHSAMNDYVIELRKKNEPSKDEIIDKFTQSNSTKSGYLKVTMNDQISAIYYIMGELGYTEAIVNKADFARLLHLLAGKDIPTNKKSIDNSPYYKSLKTSFFKGNKEKLTKKNLQLILSVFSKFRSDKGTIFNSITEKIEKDLENL